MSDIKKISQKKMPGMKKKVNKSEQMHKAKIANIKRKIAENEKQKGEELMMEKEMELKRQLLQNMKEDEERKKKEKADMKRKKRQEKKELEIQQGTYKTEKEKQKLKEFRARFGMNHDVKEEILIKKIAHEQRKQLESNDRIKDEQSAVCDGGLNEELNEKYNDVGNVKDDWEFEIESNHEYDKDEMCLWSLEKEKIKKEKREKIFKITKYSKIEPICNRICEDSCDADYARSRIIARHAECDKQKSDLILRAPVVCVLGHVDTGKTTMLDKLRHTKVQNGEVGGITQQIGATNVPIHDIPSIRELIKDLRIPGLCIIDTPGHKSFAKMRKTGRSLCDIAILVVDLMHGVEEQTVASTNLLKKKNIHFIIAINKIDRLYNWQTNPDKPIREVLNSQPPHTQSDFQDRLNQVIVQFAQLEVNVKKYWENNSDDDYVNMVPISAVTGDGMSDLISEICHLSEARLSKQLVFSENIQASVMEVKDTIGHGTTLDVILVNGRLKVNDVIVVAGKEGPIVTTIRYLLQPEPMTELRVKGEMTQLSECIATQGIKIVAKNLQQAMPGFPVYVATCDEEISYYIKELNLQVASNFKCLRLSTDGVYAQASTVGSLEVLLSILEKENIPFSGFSIGTIYKKDVLASIAVKHRDPKWGVILAYNVNVDPEAEALAKQNGIIIFQHDIIYRFIDEMTNYVNKIAKANKERYRDQVVFPSAFCILPSKLSHKSFLHVKIQNGNLHVGTPVSVITEVGIVDVGKVVMIKLNDGIESTEAKTGQEVFLKFTPFENTSPKILGRDFKVDDLMISKISRQSINILKDFYRDEMQLNDWKLVKRLKTILTII